MNLTLKNKKLVFRHLSVIFGGSACIALLHAAVDMTSIAIMDASGALIFLLLMAAMVLPSERPAEFGALVIDTNT